MKLNKIILTVSLVTAVAATVSAQENSPFNKTFTFLEFIADSQLYPDGLIEWWDDTEHVYTETEYLEFLQNLELKDFYYVVIEESTEYAYEILNIPQVYSDKEALIECTEELGASSDCGYIEVSPDSSFIREAKLYASDRGIWYSVEKDIPFNEIMNSRYLSTELWKYITDTIFGDDMDGRVQQKEDEDFLSLVDDFTVSYYVPIDIEVDFGTNSFVNYSVKEHSLISKSKQEVIDYVRNNSSDFSRPGILELKPRFTDYKSMYFAMDGSLKDFDAPFKFYEEMDHRRGY